MNRSAVVFARRLSANATRSRNFHVSTQTSVKVGDSIPSLDGLREGSPGNKVNLSDEIKGKALIIGVPGAFSPGCTANHIPPFLKHPKLKNAGDVFVIAVNDPFVTKAWGESLDPEKTSGVRFLGDPQALFTKALELDFDAAPVFGGVRSTRYALIIEDGKVKKAFVEPDRTGVNVSSAENVFENW